MPSALTETTCSFSHFQLPNTKTSPECWKRTENRNSVCGPLGPHLDESRKQKNPNQNRTVNENPCTCKKEIFFWLSAVLKFTGLACIKYSKNSRSSNSGTAGQVAVALWVVLFSVIYFTSTSAVVNHLSVVMRTRDEIMSAALTW